MLKVRVLLRQKQLLLLNNGGVAVKKASIFFCLLLLLICFLFSFSVTAEPIGGFKGAKCPACNEIRITGLTGKSVTCCWGCNNPGGDRLYAGYSIRLNPANKIQNITMPE